MSDVTSLLKKNWLKALSVVLLIAVITLGVLLYETSRQYYFEQNMHRYALYQTYWFDLFYPVNGLARLVNVNRSALNDAITDSGGIGRAADRLAYMDPPNSQAWSNISTAYQGLRSLAYIKYFPNGNEWTRPDQVYQYILSLNTALTSANTGDIAMTEGSYLYFQNGNVFNLNATAVQDAGQISGQLTHWIITNVGRWWA